MTDGVTPLFDAKQVPRCADGEVPFVTVVVPCRNEEHHIEPMIRSVKGSGYPPDRLEVIVADGMSTDGTRRILEGLAQHDGRIRIIDNPAVQKPHALNAAIAQAHGSVIIRMDAHSTYPRDYIPECVHALLKYGADNVGGVQAAVPDSDRLMSRAICAFYNGALGLRRGRASSPRAHPTLAHTVFCGCFRRDVFDRFGWFDTKLPRGQDRELNARIRAGGGKILLLPWVEAHYRPRSSLRSHLRYMILAGLVPFSLQGQTGTTVLGLRNVVTALAGLLALSAMPLCYAVPNLIWPAMAVAAGYLTITVTGGVCMGLKNRSIRLAIVYTPIVWMSHLMYGLGALFGTVDLAASSLRTLASRAFSISVPPSR